MHDHSRSRPAIIAIPAKNEAEHIGPCLRALAWQRDVRGQHVVLLVNNTTDDTLDVVRGLQPLLPMPVHVIEHCFPPAEATAGHARRLAMQHAADLIGPGGVLLTTDADGRPEPDWLARNLAAIGRGVDAVAGCAVLDPADAAAIPARLHEDDARECAYSDLLDRIAWLLDPEPYDPLPRHAEHSGASICVTVEAFHRVGGIPAVLMGEDRAFFDALRRHDMTIRHEPEARVLVSGRIVGRAKGGMADTIRRRLQAPDPTLDDRLEPVGDWIRRYRLRARIRRAWATRDPLAGQALAHALRLPVGLVRDLLAGPYFGQAWAEIEARSPALVRHPVTLQRLQTEMSLALQFDRHLLHGVVSGAIPRVQRDDKPAGVA